MKGLDDSSAGYAFGDTNLAVQRLQLLASVFAPTSRQFLSDLPLDPCDIALDLGCGPGYTTRLIADAVSPKRVIGIDNSSNFIALARSLYPDLTFEEHDVTESPLPHAPADFIYCRYVLSHLHERSNALAEWVSDLTPAGCIAVEENESIETDSSALHRYLEILESLLAHNGHDLYVGRHIANQAPPEEAEVVSNAVVRLSPPTQVVARMFSLNLMTWGEDPYVHATHAADEIDDLARRLEELASTSTAQRITWTLRQLVFKRSS